MFWSDPLSGGGQISHRWNKILIQCFSVFGFLCLYFGIENLVVFNEFLSSLLRLLKLLNIGNQIFLEVFKTGYATPHFSHLILLDFQDVSQLIVIQTCRINFLTNLIVIEVYFGFVFNLSGWIGVFIGRWYNFLDSFLRSWLNSELFTFSIQLFYLLVFDCRSVTFERFLTILA